jgi:phenylpropionate dioxygenase-like ring-hydroxylating dioxygenase large terminal subunit
MINNQWYAVAPSKDFKKGRLYPVERMGLKLVFFRNCKGELHILSDRCPHRGASVGMRNVVNGHL